MEDRGVKIKMLWETILEFELANDFGFINSFTKNQEERVKIIEAR